MRLNEARCYDCGRPYGDEHGFPDLVIPHEAWKQISPSGDEGGLLCPSCLCHRLAISGIRCEGAFTSGPIESVSEADLRVRAGRRALADSPAPPATEAGQPEGQP